jgi:hypothetical protein
MDPIRVAVVYDSLTGKDHSLVAGCCVSKLTAQDAILGSLDTIQRRPGC